jgi:DNA-binding NarL/FixJ family response regulator
LRVLVLDETESNAHTIERELTRAGMRVVTERVDTKEAFVEALHTFGPDVVLADHTLPQFDSIAAMEILRAVRPSAALIVMSSALEDRSLVACMRAGADDIVHKRDMSTVADNINAALTVRRPLERLTARQLEVLRLVAQGNTTPQIAKQLNLSAKTIETHRSEVMRRLGVHDVVQLVRYAVRVGLVSPYS